LKERLRQTDREKRYRNKESSILPRKEKKQEQKSEEPLKCFKLKAILTLRISFIEFLRSAGNPIKEIYF